MKLKHKLQVDEINMKHADYIVAQFEIHEKGKLKLASKRETSSCNDRSLDDSYVKLLQEYDLLKASFNKYKCDLQREMNNKMKVLMEKNNVDLGEKTEMQTKFTGNNFEVKMKVEKDKIVAELVEKINEMMNTNRSKLESLKLSYLDGKLEFTTCSFKQMVFFASNLSSSSIWIYGVMD